MKASDPVDSLFAELMRAGESPDRIRAVLEGPSGDAVVLTGALRRPVPARVLEVVGTTPPWSGDARVLAAVVLSPRAPRTLSLRLLPALFWRDLADVAAVPRVDASVRVRAEALLIEVLPDLRLGERITLARLATPRVLRLLLTDAEEKVVAAGLNNPRLTEEDLLVALAQTTPSAALLQALPASSRWSEAYAVRLALVLQPRTPLAIALAQLTSLLPRDLLRVGQTAELRPLVQAVALKLAGGQARAGREAAGGRNDD